MKEMLDIKIPPMMDFASISGLSNEVVENCNVSIRQHSLQPARLVALHPLPLIFYMSILSYLIENKKETTLL